MADDPFTQVLNRLWAVIEGNATLAALIKPGNRIKLTGEGQIPDKSNAQDADRPSLLIHPVGGPMNPHGTSTSITVTERYTFVLVTSKVKVDPTSDGLYPVKWALLKVLIEASLNNLDLAFVIDADLIDDDIVEVVSERGEDQRGTRGWSLGLTMAVRLRFNRIGNVVQDP